MDTGALRFIITAASEFEPTGIYKAYLETAAKLDAVHTSQSSSTTMAPTPFKFTKSGRETRRFTFPNPPTWLSLETRISSLFDIPAGKVAVSYEDHDGDMVTMSSQEELGDYFANFHKASEPVKLTVIDLRELRAARGEAAGNAEDLRDSSAAGGFPPLGETMFIEVDDDWQRLPGMPLFGMGLGERTPEELPHAFVEVVESDVSGSKKTSQRSISDLSSLSSLNQHRTVDKGKAKAADTITNQTQATSEASIVENDQPLKHPVHVYDVSDAAGLSPRADPLVMKSPMYGQPSLPSGMPRNSVFGGGNDDLLAPIGVSSPRADSEQSKPLPRTPNSQRDSFHPLSTLSTQTTPRQLHANELPPPPSESTAGARSAGFAPKSSPSFVNDVAGLLEGLTAAVASHPELSEGLRNLVKSTIDGTYFEAERERVVNAAENVRLAAEQTSERIARAAGNMATYSEQEAGRRIAKALSDVFKVIGEISSGFGNLPGPPQTPTQRGPPRAREPPVRSPTGPPQHFFPPPPTRGHTMPGGWPGFGGPPPPGFLPQGQFLGHPGNFPHHFGHPHAPPPPPPPRSSAPFGPIPPSSDVPATSPSHRTVGPWESGRVGSHPSQRSGPWSSRYDQYMPPYFAGYPFDYYTEPYHNRPDNQRPDIHETKAQLEAAKAVYKAEKERFKQEKEERRKLRQEVAQKRAEEGKKPRDGEREETIVARIALPSPSKGPGRYAEVVSVPTQHSRQPGPSNTGVVPAPIPPLPQPVARPPPVSSHGGGMSSLLERIMARLADMGITTYTHPDMVNTLNEIVTPNGEPTKDSEEDIIAKLVATLNIRGSPSPRPSGSRLP